MRASSPAARPRVIVADDHAQIRRILVQLVAATLPQAEVIETEDGVQALHAYQAGGADFLVSNHQMPNLDGMGLVREVRRHAPALPILMVSVHRAAKTDALAAGANWFLGKEQLAERMPDLLRRYTGTGIDPGED